MLFALCTGAFCVAGIAAPALADNSRQTVTWQNFDDKDPLSDKVTHEAAGQVSFPDGNLVQVFARCAPPAVGGKYPGMTIIVGAFDGSLNAPKAYLWQKGAAQLPLLVNDQQRPPVHASTDNPRANFVSIGFYDPVAAKALFQANTSPAPPLLKQVQAYNQLSRMKQEMAWDNFTAEAAGTLTGLLQATSIRVQLPLADFTADVIEMNPQDPVLKAYAQQCSARIQAHTR